MLKLIDRAVAYEAGAIDAEGGLQMTRFKERTATKTIAARKMSAGDLMRRDSGLDIF